MTRLTGKVKQTDYAILKCEFCNRYFRNTRLHQATGTACRKLREEVN